MKNKSEMQLHFPSLRFDLSVELIVFPPHRPTPELLCEGGDRIYGLALERGVEARSLLMLFPFICRQEINNTERCNCRYFGLQMRSWRC
jgi:hypothetical protein